MSEAADEQPCGDAGRLLEQRDPPARCTRRCRGFVLSLIAMASFSPDALLVRLMHNHRTPAPHESELSAACVISAWKNLLLGCLNLIAARVDGSSSALCPGDGRGKKMIAAASTFQAVQQMGFTLAYVFTDPATALLLISLNPLWAALLGWRLLHDALPCRTVVALSGAALAVLVVFLPPLLLPSRHDTAGRLAAPSDGYSPEAFAGDVVAFLTGLSLAGYLIVVRHAATACPRASMGGAAGFGALLASAISFVVAAASGGALVEGLTIEFAGLALADALGLALGYVMLSHAPRLVTGAEVALALQLQVVLSPLLVYLGLGVAPSAWTIVGGCLLLTTLGVHELMAARHGRRATRSLAVVRSADVAAEVR